MPDAPMTAHAVRKLAASRLVPTMAMRTATPIAPPIWRDIFSTAVPVAYSFAGKSAVPLTRKPVWEVPADAPIRRMPGKNIET